MPIKTCLGCQRCETEHVVTLKDGRVVCDQCPDWRHECEVRGTVDRLYPDGAAMGEFLAEVEKKRGAAAAERLRVDCRVEWVARKAG